MYLICSWSVLHSHTESFSCLQACSFCFTIIIRASKVSEMFVLFWLEKLVNSIIYSVEKFALIAKVVAAYLRKPKSV